MLQWGRGTGLHGPRRPREDLTGDFPKKCHGGFRTILEGTFSEAIILVVHEMFLELLFFRQGPETFKTTPAQVPRSNH